MAAERSTGACTTSALQGAQGGAGFRADIENGYGGATGVEEWIELAQFVYYEGYRAMFEAQSKYRMGVSAVDEPLLLAFVRVADLRLFL